MATAAASNMADGIRTSSFSLLGLLVTTDPRLIAAIALTANLPSFLLALPAGILIDKVDKYKILISAQATRVSAFCALFVLSSANALTYWHLALVTFVVGACEVFFDSCTFATVPKISHEDKFGTVNASLRVVQEIGNGTIGPALGAALFAWSPSLPGLSMTILCLVALLILIIDSNQRMITAGPPKMQTTGEWRRILHESRGDLFDGFHAIGTDPYLRTVIWVMFAWNLVAWIPEGVLVIFVTRNLQAPGAIYGLLLTCTSVGSLFGGLLYRPLTKRINLKIIVILGLFVYAATNALPAIYQNLLVTTISFFFQGVPLMVIAIALSTATQRKVSHQFLGRVITAQTLVSKLAATISLGIGGYITHVTDPSVALGVSGGGLVAVALSILKNHHLRVGV